MWVESREYRTDSWERLLHSTRYLSVFLFSEELNHAKSGQTFKSYSCMNDILWGNVRITGAWRNNKTRSSTDLPCPVQTQLFSFLILTTSQTDVGWCGGAPPPAPPPSPGLKQQWVAKSWCRAAQELRWSEAWWSVVGQQSDVVS